MKKDKDLIPLTEEMIADIVVSAVEQKRNRKPHIFYYKGFWRVTRAVQPWRGNWEKTTNMNLHVKAHFFVGMLNDARDLRK